MPKASCRIFATGAAAWAVHEAFETIRCSGAELVVVDAHDDGDVGRLGAAARRG